MRVGGTGRTPNTAFFAEFGVSLFSEFGVDGETGPRIIIISCTFFTVADLCDWAHFFF